MNTAFFSCFPFFDKLRQNTSVYKEGGLDMESCNLLATGRAEADYLEFGDVWATLSEPEANLGYSETLFHEHTEPPFIQILCVKNFRSGDENLAQLVERLRFTEPGPIPGPGCTSVIRALGRWMDVGGTGGRGCPWLHIEFDASLGTKQLYFIIYPFFHVFIILTFKTMHSYGLRNHLHE